MFDDVPATVSGIAWQPISAPWLHRETAVAQYKIEQVDYLGYLNRTAASE
jgi:hypothetical protein